LSSTSNRQQVWRLGFPGKGRLLGQLESGGGRADHPACVFAGFGPNGVSAHDRERLVCLTLE